MTEKLYLNKEWLYQKYVAEQLSTVEIGKLCNCSHKIILHKLKKYDIQIRTRGQALSIKYKKDADINDARGYSKYKNYEYLYQKYTIERKTAKEIGDELGYEQSTIVKWLRLLNIKGRNVQASLKEHRRHIRKLVYKRSEAYNNIVHDYYTIYANDYNKITPTIAMEIGFLFGDGSIRKNHIRIGLDKKDVEILDYFNSVWFNTYKQYYQRHTDNLYYLCFYSDQMQTDLNKLGIVDNKTYLNYTIDWLFNVDITIRKAFLYGLILADGSIRKKQRLISIVNHISSETFLTKLIQSIFKLNEFHIYYSNSNQAVRYNLNRDATIKLATDIKMLVDYGKMPKLLDRKYMRLVSKLDGSKSYV